MITHLIFKHLILECTRMRTNSSSNYQGNRNDKKVYQQKYHKKPNTNTASLPSQSCQ